MNDPIWKSVRVPLTPTEAFALFTRDIDTWWPKEKHTVTGKDGTPPNLRFPKEKGAPIIEEGDDGTIHVWGRLIAYDPGRYLAFSWFPGGAEADATIVQVSFNADGDGTQVDLTHGDLDSLGPLADAVSTSYLRDWGLILGCYCKAAGHLTPVSA
ncbi:SRPBCC domain-containing protein [Yoonia sp. SS1-5]|uniref:SRPBCC domain-containing protein n=1 Tax=Yoonia rhodophyticola TaxID=3137370 RepID=A0AAN0M8Y4_9RHOB